MNPRRTWPLALYSALGTLFAPVAVKRSRERMRIAGISADRFDEICGQTPHQRPKGRLLWCHAASVGESLSVLPLLGNIVKDRPDLYVLLTTGTPTSAKALQGRMPARTAHQFAPLDSRRYVRRFVKHWQPDAALFVESELWPNMLLETAQTQCPMALVNARLSQNSLRRWRTLRPSLIALLSCFDSILCADSNTREGLASLGIAPDCLATMPPLKRLGANAIVPVPDEGLRAAMQPHPVWIAASTHPGEDEIILAAHRIMRRTCPELRLILAPRHPERAEKIARLVRHHGLSLSQRSRGQVPDTEVYLADTIGEMELFISLARFVFVGGSLTDNGGHNPFEALRAGVPVLTGPFRQNFALDYQTILDAGAGCEVTDAESLAQTALHWLTTPKDYARASDAALRLGRPDPAALAALASRLSDVLRL